jgi:dTDP-4-dehydrorhamnose 3,5-epimerase
MATAPLQIDGCWVFNPNVFGDERGTFFEWFQDTTFENETGQRFDIAQANISISGKGVLRGIHYANVPPGQGKYVTCISGSVLDVVVDLRKSSATFGQWNSVVLDSKNPKALYIPSGVGHAFMALEDHSTFVYLCDQRYNPKNEFDLNAFDKEINIDWPKDIRAIQSEKDSNAPNLRSILDVLPN